MDTSPNRSVPEQTKKPSDVISYLLFIRDSTDSFTLHDDNEEVYYEYSKTQAKVTNEPRDLFIHTIARQNYKRIYEKNSKQGIMYGVSNTTWSRFLEFQTNVVLTTMRSTHHHLTARCSAASCPSRARALGKGCSQQMLLRYKDFVCHDAIFDYCQAVIRKGVNSTLLY